MRFNQLRSLLRVLAAICCVALPLVGTAAPAGAGLILASHESVMEPLDYSGIKISDARDFSFQQFWNDQISSVMWNSPRGVTLYSRYFFNADGRRLYITMLDAGGACGMRECPIRIYTELGALVTEFSDCDQPALHFISADKRSFIGCGLEHPIPQAGSAGSLESITTRQLLHNGSIVEASFYKNGGVQIRYSEPKRGLPSNFRGQLLFQGVLNTRGTLVGTAYTFKSGCDPAPYSVSGAIDRHENFTLTGEAPRRDPKSCEILGFTAQSSNARLRFVDAGMDGD